MRIAAVAAALALAGAPVSAGGSRALEAPARNAPLSLPELPAAALPLSVETAPPAEALAPEAAMTRLSPAPAAAAAPEPASRPLAALRRFIGLGGRGAVERVSAALAGIPTVRAYFAEAPGFGHQSATLAAARRLRELGYQGEIQGIYEATVEEKLGVLVPEFDPKGPSIQRIPSLGMTLESLEHYEGRAERARVPLALTGGNDLGAKQTSKLAWKLRAKAFLSLQPLGWRNTANELYRDDASKTPLPWARNLPFIYEPARPERLDDAYFDALSRQPSQTPAKVEGLRALTRRLGEHDVLPAYGLAFFSPDMMHRLLLGVSAAMDRRPELFARKGVVIPLLLDARDLVAPLKAGQSPAAADWNARADDRRVKTVAAAHEGLTGKLEFARIDDPDLAARLDGLRAGRILVLETGPVPPAVFESLFASATLPPTVEGKNATNLARLLGIPFLSINQASLNDALDIGVGAVGAHFRHGLRQLDWRAYGGRRAAAAAEALSEQAWPQGLLRHDFETLASYIVEALRPGSRLRAWFSRRRLRRDDFRKDKVARALAEALR